MTHRTVLVIVAHTDDETLGAGGAIARHVDIGDSVYVASMTDGVSARATIGGDEKYARSVASVGVSKILGFNWLKASNFPDNEMDTVAKHQTQQSDVRNL
jgi:LmbE family N-acetylglucosaminyl deacetylase